MAITEQEFEAANSRAMLKKAAFPGAVSVEFDEEQGCLGILLDSGLKLGFPLTDIESLRSATAADLAQWQVSPSGLGIHFPTLDVDIYLPSLLESFLNISRWRASEMGKVGGKATTAAKADASRRNGRLGGRPRAVKA